MSTDLNTEETGVFATYTTRRDAEMARDCLADAGIQAFVKSDDAGGMYPQLQSPHGVKLVGMTGTTQRARTTLDDAGLLPDEGPGTNPPSGDPEGPTVEMANSMYGIALFLGVVAAVFVLLMILLG